jgi:hypothetical protein
MCLDSCIVIDKWWVLLESRDGAVDNCQMWHLYAEWNTLEYGLD